MPSARRHLPLSRRRTLGLLAGGLAAPAVARADVALRVRSFSIATGGLGGTYYPVGGVLANLLTAPPGGLDCRPGEPCGVVDMVAVAQTSEGSVANVKGLRQGLVDSAFCQADVAFQAWRGEGPFVTEPMPNLRVIASLYPEMAQLVVLDEAQARPLRLAIGAPGSGTRVAAERLLHGFGLDNADTERLELNPGPSIDAMLTGQLDGFLTVAGLPTPAVHEALELLDARLVGTHLQAAREFLRERSFWGLRTIPAGLYPGQERTLRTLAVAALWVVDANLDDGLVFEILAALWAPEAVPVLTAGHPVGAHITLASALEGISVPLHPAASQFYREQGLLGPAAGFSHPPPPLIGPPEPPEADPALPLPLLSP